MSAPRIVLALALAAGIAGCEEDAAPPIPPRPVLVETVEPITIETFGPFASIVEARYQAQLGFQVSGRMIARDVYVGDRVAKGQRLAAIDPTIVQFNPLEWSSRPARLLPDHGAPCPTQRSARLP